MSEQHRNTLNMKELKKLKSVLGWLRVFKLVYRNPQGAHQKFTQMTC